MSRKALIYLLVAAVAAVSAVVGVVASGALGSTPALPTMSAAQLLTKVATEARATTAIHGDFSWSNGLIPGSDLSSLLSGGSGSSPSSLTSLALGGSGRLWIQQGGGVRLEAQGSGSDFVVVAGKGGLWTYSSANNTAVNYSRPSGTPSPTASPSPQTSTLDPLATITTELQRFAAIGTVTVSNAANVAGQPSYLITVTPAAGTNTTFGSLQVAIDGKTFVPLRAQVFAKGDGTASLSAGFTDVSYASNPASLFEFTPPAGASVQHQSLPSSVTGGSMVTPSSSGQALTLAQAQAKAQSYGLNLLSATTSTALPFKGAAVLPSSDGSGATAVLHYGTGFASVVLIESNAAAGKTSTGQAGGLPQQLSALPKGLIATTTLGSDKAYELSTSLIATIGWQHGGVTLVAAGMVPSTTLHEFAAGVH